VMEAQYLTAGRREAAALAEAEKFTQGDDSESARKARTASESVSEALAKRRVARWRFGVSSKNSSRIKSLLTLAAPHLRRSAKSFNPDALKFACNTHTLRFRKIVDLENPDPEGVRHIWAVEARKGHWREDYITGFSPCDYDPEARCPKFEKFLTECQPTAEVRRTLQIYAATGLFARLEQKIAYHYGNGANGKSVFLAVITAVIGETQCVSLPKETVMGQGERGAGQASPDLIRLLWKRTLNVAELKDGEELREDVVKRLTGGDPMAVRGLYEGYIEFENVATPHMSGNGLPTIKGLDNGIWRRVFTIPWGVTIAEDKRREFKEFVADLLSERAGILNWLIAGACDYLNGGLYIAPACKVATSEYRAEMDPIGEFAAGCLVVQGGSRIQAHDLWVAYVAWAKANGRTEFGAAKFGRVIKGKPNVKMEQTGGFRWYRDLALSPEAARLVNPRRDEDER
jgi:putative DNA primase/helicase